MLSDVLPQPLEISRSLEGNPSKDNGEFLDDYQRNLAVVQWSQFVANDLNKPVVTTMSKFNYNIRLQINFNLKKIKINYHFDLLMYFRH